MSELRYTANALLRDTETRLIIPSKEIIVGGALTGLATQLLSNADLEDLGFTSTRGMLDTLLRSVLTGPLLTLGVTEIRIRGKMVLPKTKGIGSVGQIIHLMGSENERLNLKFTTDRFPGPMASILRKMLKITLDNADLVYVVDDLLAVAPCLLVDYDLHKTGQLKSAIIGDLKLEVLNTKGFSGLRGIGFTFLSTLSITAVSNMITELSQPFKWMGELVRERANKR